MVHIRASVVTSDDPIFSPGKIGNALGLTTLGGEMLAVLADVPWLIVELRCFISVRRSAVPHSLTPTVGQSRYGHRRNRSVGTGRSAPEVLCTQ
jgi:hypothetical protein